MHIISNMLKTNFIKIITLFSGKKKIAAIYMKTNEK